MHFVKKQPTTEEQRATTERHKAVKLKIYCDARDIIFAKRSKGELDDEMLGLTAKILSKNPDINTFWNIRREVLDSLKDNERIEIYYHNELLLTEECIKENPKSYSAWFQRGWILRRQRKPNLELELKMCEEALKMDCRNFHCWDHWRVVASMAKVSEEEKLKFSNKLIKENFSNYSAWHMRIGLLERVVDAEKGTISLSSETQENEIKKMASAVFVDPHDQAAWMYARWLISLHSTHTSMAEEWSSSLQTQALSISRHGKRITLVLNRPLTLQQSQLFLRGSEITLIPSAQDTKATMSRVWVGEVSDSESTVEGSLDGADFTAVAEGQPVINKEALLNIWRPRPCDFIDRIKKICDDIREEDAESALSVLTETLCLRATSPIEEHSRIETQLRRLGSELDSLRVNMYNCILSRERLRYALMSPEKEKEGKSRLESLLDGETTSLSLCYLQLTEVEDLFPLAGLLTDLDLRGNQIGCLEHLPPLPNLVRLGLDENPLKKLTPLLGERVPNLEFLSVGGCRELSTVSLSPALHSLPSISKFLFCETPLVNETESIRDALQERDIRLIPYYI